MTDFTSKTSKTATHSSISRIFLVSIPWKIIWYHYTTGIKLLLAVIRATLDQIETLFGATSVALKRDSGTYSMANTMVVYKPH